MRYLFALIGVATVGFFTVVAAAVIDQSAFFGWLLFLSAIGSGLGFMVHDRIFVPTRPERGSKQSIYLDMYKKGLW